jgi:hypothetical protein
VEKEEEGDKRTRENERGRVFEGENVYSSLERIGGAS